MSRARIYGYALVQSQAYSPGTLPTKEYEVTYFLVSPDIFILWATPCLVDK